MKFDKAGAHTTETQVMIPPKDAAVVTFQDSDNELVLVVLDATDAEISDWVLDSGCSYHICRD